jgi:chorismate mutase
MLQTAVKLAQYNVDVFRAGIWKPRTHPDTFEGVGTVGLKWLKKVKETTGLLTATEVANQKHVEEALKYEIDILWVGARTTSHPFAVQEIADALKGTDIIVLVKNPIYPDVELWLGAIERFNKVGIKKIGAVHRGFFTYGRKLYRNMPQWLVPIELKRQIPELPVICDPSHICGNTDLLLEISQKAMDLNFDGLMIESHVNPKVALSDASQQITPDELNLLINKLVLRNLDSIDLKFINTLKELRQQIDHFDEEMINVFAQRMQIAETIGRYKKENNITIIQPVRWDEIIRTNLNKGIKKGLSEEFIMRLFKAIHQESINRQTKVMNE